MAVARSKRWIGFAAVAALVVVASALSSWTWRAGWEETGDGVFLVKPYVQWGPETQRGSPAGVDVLWQGEDRDESWALEVRAAGDTNALGEWVAMEPPAARRVAIQGLRPRRLYRSTASVPGGTPGSDFRYRVMRGGAPVFEARAHAPWNERHPHRFVVFGDGGADTAAQREVAYQAYQARP
jgi:hypothetical protein